MTFEELCHNKTDPGVLKNLIADPSYADVLNEMHQELANEMVRTDDFMLEKFEGEFGIKATTNN